MGITVNILQEYLSDLIYYFLSLAVWLQLSVLVLLLALQAGLEGETALRLKTSGFSAISRIFLVLLFLGLFWRETRNLFHERMAVTPKSYWGLGLSAESNGLYRKAVAYFKKAQAEGENNPAFYLSFAEALRQNGQDREALAEAESSPGKSMQKYLMIGRIYVSLHDYKRAQKFLETASEMAPHDLLVQAWLGETYLHLHEPGKAADTFKAILRNPRLPKELKVEYSEKIKGLQAK